MSFIFLFVRMRYGLALYDDGVLYYGAERVLEGDVPYKDFWFIYTPGNLYVLAFLFKVFGPSILIARIFNTIICFFIVIVTYLITRKITNRIIIIPLIIFLITLLVGLDGYYANTNLPLLFSLMSIFYFMKYLEEIQNKYLILTGLLIGFSAIFRLDFGLYTFLSVFITLLLFEYQNLSSTFKMEKLKIISKKVVLMSGSALLVFMPVFVYFISIVPLNELIDLFLVFPSKIYPLYRYLPYPPLSTILSFIMMYFPLLMFIVTFIWLIYKVKDESISKKEWMIILILIYGVVSLNYVIVRSDFVHMYPVMISAIILFCFFFSFYENTGDIFLRFRKQKEKSQYMNIQFIILSIMIILSFTSLFADFMFVTYSYSVPLNVERGDGILIAPYQADIISVVNYIKRNVPSNEKIFVGYVQHDRICDNNVMLYFLADRKSATRYHDMHPGVVTTLPVQEEIVNELKENKVKYIVLWGGNKDYKEPNKSNESSGVMELDNFIRDNYRITEVIGNYTIYTIK